MTASSLLASNSNPTEEEISASMSRNICRCGTYDKINEAVKKASENV
jgi:isoquinoline 1-oxidoreductase alpha subunit